MISWFKKETPTVMVPAPTGASPAWRHDGSWIPVKEQVPEYGVRVLLCDKEYGVLSGHRYSSSEAGEHWELGCLTYFGGYSSPARTRTVTHWMPLPQAPGSKT